MRIQFIKAEMLRNNIDYQGMDTNGQSRDDANPDNKDREEPDNLFFEEEDLSVHVF